MLCIDIFSYVNDMVADKPFYRVFVNSSNYSEQQATDRLLFLCVFFVLPSN